MSQSSATVDRRTVPKNHFVKNVSDLSVSCYNVSVCVVSTGDAPVSTMMRWRDHIDCSVN